MSNIQLARLVEYTPRLLQIARLAHLSGTPLQKEMMPGVYIESACKDCGLSAPEADTTILSLPSPGVVSFSMAAPSLYVPGHYELHILALTYLRVRDARILAAYQTEKHYTPCVLRAGITTYDKTGGLATFYAPPLLVLEDTTEGALYEYSTSDLGTKIYPIVAESYLVKIV